MNFDICVKNIKNMQSNFKIFKICNNFNFLVKVATIDYNQVCSQTLYFVVDDMNRE